MAKNVGMMVSLTTEAADALLVEQLRYWKKVLRPMKGDHPDDAERNKKLCAAIKLLLEFMEA